MLRTVHLVALGVFMGAAPAAAPRHSFETLPESRGGQDRVGTEFPELEFERMVGPAPAEHAAVTLYRWWTDQCPYCRASLPAVESLRKQFGPRGLRIIAVYHPKPPRRVDDADVLATAQRLGYHGPVAIDDDWSLLREAYLDTGPRRRATSVTFLVDTEGVTRFLHPGPVFHPSDDPEDATENADYLLLRNAIEVLLEEASAAEKPISRSKQ